MSDPAGKPTSRTVLDRRRLLLGGAVASVGGVAAADSTRHDGALGGPPQTFSGTMPWRGGAADFPPMPQRGTGYVWFNPAEAAFVEAAVDRMIPKDEVGPSGTEADVPLFIDRQLAGGFGHGEHYYLGGPWPKGTPEQGYQSRLTPAGLYRAAISAIDGWARNQHGKVFHGLGPDDQDAVLNALESGAAKLGGGVEAKTFFDMFLQNVKEGYFADPVYGGNKDMAAWKMIGFPGAHYDYKAWVTRHGERVPFPPVGLRGRPGWSQA